MGEQIQETPIDPSEVQAAFEQVLQELRSGKLRTPGRQPVRFERLQSVFSGNETTPVSVDDLAAAFTETVDPQKSAITAVGHLNKLFGEMGIGLVIERTSFYQFRRK